MKPPKCRACGAEEWRHVCQGPLEFAKVTMISPEADGSVVVRGRRGDGRMVRERQVPTLIEVSKPVAVASTKEEWPIRVGDRLPDETGDGHSILRALKSALAASQKPTRTEYLKVKARERRARERIAADALGITVKEWRARKKT